MVFGSAIYVRGGYLHRMSLQKILDQRGEFVGDDHTHCCKECGTEDSMPSWTQGRHTLCLSQDADVDSFSLHIDLGVGGVVENTDGGHTWALSPRLTKSSLGRIMADKKFLYVAHLKPFDCLEFMPHEAKGRSCGQPTRWD